MQQAVGQLASQRGAARSGVFGDLFGGVFPVLIAMLIAGALGAGPLWAMDNRALEIAPGSLEVSRSWWRGMSVEMILSDPVPYALRLADDPPRLLIHFAGAMEAAAAADLPEGAVMVPDRNGVVLRLPLDRPRRIERAEMRAQEDGQMRLSLRLARTDAEAFATAVARDGATTPVPTAPDPARRTRLRVMLDPGHGGYDPGAQHGGVREADLVLIMARLVQAELERAGAEVALTRDGDNFVSLSDRIARANRAKADVFVSLHADAVSVGHATGASVHSLPDAAAAAGNRFLLRRLGQEALGSTKGPIGDETARVLMELAREDAQKNGAALADRLVASMGAAGVDLYKTPRKRSNFVVLRAADMASVLIELGFLSEARDRARLNDPLWREQMAAAIAAGVLEWSRAGGAATGAQAN